MRKINFHTKQCSMLLNQKTIITKRSILKQFEFEYKMRRKDGL